MQSLFSYTKGNSIIHRTPVWLKILLLLAIPITLYMTPIQVCIVFIPLLFIVALIAKIGLGSFLKDLRPIIIYSLMILAIDVLSYFISSKNGSISLDGIMIGNYTAPAEGSTTLSCAPMLINNAGSCVELEIYNVSADGTKYSSGAKV